MRLARPAVTVVLVTGLLSPVTAQAAPPAPPPERQDVSAITLITGDKAVVNDRGELVRVEGRPGMTFAQYVQDGHQYVVPADAVDDVVHDRVDKRFFDVTALHSFGYTDDRIDRIPLLDSGLRAAAAVQKAEAAQRWTSRARARGAGKLWLDGKSRLLLDQSVPMVGAPAAWEAGYDGTGVTVAVLDTGYDQNHPELAGAVAVAKDFTVSGIQDDVGHGTHVASTIAGRSARYGGVAQGAKLAIGRVCEGQWCQDSAILAGMEWAAREAGAKVINLSLGGDQSDGTDPMSLKVNELTAETGALFVVAAGNAGEYRKVSAPASADAALAVANLSKSGTLYETSSRGPREGDFAVKPDIAAPGTDIVAARAAGTLWDFYVDDLHARLTGTSMAAPHVAGAAAILAQRNPSWTAAELKAHLMATVKPVADTSAHVGTGLLDVGRAVTQPVRADVGSLSFGLLEWPHTKTFSKTITYRNDGPLPVSLTLTHDLGADFTVPPSVTVPAGGTAPVEVVLDPAKGDGRFFGHVRASADGVSVTTAVGAYVQEEHHTLTLSVIGRDGRPPQAQSVFLLANLTTGEASALLGDEDGVTELTLPSADYAVLAEIEETTPNSSWYTPVSQTTAAGRISLAQDASVELDLRRAEPTSVRVPDTSSVVWDAESKLSLPGLRGRSTALTGSIDGRVPRYSLPFGAALPDLTHDLAVIAGHPLVSVVGGFPVTYFESSTRLPAGDHVFDVAEQGGDVGGKLVLVRGGTGSVEDTAQELADAGAAAVLWAGPRWFASRETAIPVLMVGEHHVTDTPRRLTVRAVDTSPVSYTMHLREQGALPAGVKQIRRSDLAEVKARYHSSNADGWVTNRSNPMPGGVFDGQFGVMDERLKAPAERTEYYSAGTWYFEGFDSASSTTWADLKPMTLAAGRKYERTNLRAVASPRLGRPSAVSWSLGGGVHRAGDSINVRISPFGGSGWVENWQYSGYAGVELKRDGKPLGWADAREGTISAPDRDGRYTLTLEAGRDTSALSTQVRTEWGFSAAADGPLPLPEVDYSLPVDLRNSWKAGVPMPVRFTASGTVRELKAYASFDDGATWAPVKSLVPAGGKAGGFVSLRVVAVDTDGNSVDQTVVRAYRLRA